VKEAETYKVDRDKRHERDWENGKEGEMRTTIRE